MFFKNQSKSSVAKGNRHRELQKCFSRCLFSIRKSAHSIYPFLSPTIKGKSKTGGRKTMKTKRKYFYLDDFEHRLLVGCLMTARNEYIHEDKPIEDVNELILKIIDAPSKKLRVIVKEDA